jgi:hypothetical protein
VTCACPRTFAYASFTELLHRRYFASLGALPDFADSLVDFAYEKQTQCDMLNEPYYYECLQAIAKQRSSDELQLKTTMLESRGLVSRRDLSEAYRSFQLPADGGSADDDRIYNIFHAQQGDLGAQQQERAREMLGRIGRQRGSKLLTNASMQTIETAQEAYAWLGNGLGPETDDSFVVSIFSLRVSLIVPSLCAAQGPAPLALDARAGALPQQFANLTSRPKATKIWKTSVAKQYLSSRANVRATI